MSIVAEIAETALRMRTDVHEMSDAQIREAAKRIGEECGRECSPSDSERLFNLLCEKINRAEIAAARWEFCG